MCLSVQSLWISLVTSIASGNCPQTFFFSIEKNALITFVSSCSLWLQFFLANILNIDLAFDWADEASFWTSRSNG